jgi:hypothetical protein
MGRRIASQSKQTVRGGPKPAKVGLHRRLILKYLEHNIKSQPYKALQNTIIYYVTISMWN